MGAVSATTDATFENDVIKAQAPVVVDFWAPWCGPCRMIAPALDAISTELGDKVKIVKVNVDENPKIASNYGIMSIPTLMIFKDGKLVDRKTGASPQAALKQWITTHA
ncbi:thioredoxin [Phreatobacter sp. AB_2022a]|uniref:thioredoxin n=1 Tax=Phreatobacter sp. AB_2022a TaxID=3003134 RepID=UPI0005704BB3|nr:thioredoxin [Phreatobacter sp. AB_2022a]MCZ0735052.1 thioredoxin [Phreatobacter sp. AB_2022a]CEJ10725.1 Thioredoxin-1 [bacterium YEK0313]